MFCSSRTCLGAIIALLVAAPVVVAQPISVTVFPTLAPNVYGSVSYPTWENNAISALQLGSSSAGNSALPDYYQQIPSGSLIPMWIASEFNSWHTLANPGVAFGPAFAGELGNRIYFNLHIVGNTQQFSISQLSFVASSTDVGNFLGYSLPAGSYNYSSAFVGLNYGQDGMKGTGDDFLVTGGANTQLINELFARGSGNAPAVSNADPGATDQDKIDNALAQLPNAFIFNGAFTLHGDGDDFNGSAFVVVSVPEPATIAMTAVGGSALAFACVSQWKKRRRRKVRASSKPVLAKV